MKAIILCAGIGSRLRPFTNDRPKCLVEINKKPIISYQIDALINAGINDIIMVTGYMAEKIEHYCKTNYNQTFTYIFNKNYKTTNSLYSLYLANKLLNGDDFILINGDIVFDNKLLKSLLDDVNSTAALVDDKMEIKDGEMNVIIKNKKIVEFSKKISKKIASAQSLQLTKFSAQDNKLLFIRAEELLNTNERTTAFPAKAYDVIFNKSAMHPVFHTEGQWFEIDTVEDLSYCEKTIQ